MKKLMIAAALASALLSADGLYSVSYPGNSAVEAPLVGTGLKICVDPKELRSKRIKEAFNLHFDGKELEQGSKERLQKALANLKPGEYIALIGHSSSIKDPKEEQYLNRWERLWQGLLDGRPTQDEAIGMTNARLRSVYDLLQKQGVAPSRIYAENRLDRDPIATEATKTGKALNERLQVLILR